MSTFIKSYKIYVNNRHLTIVSKNDHSCMSLWHIATSFSWNIIDGWHKCLTILTDKLQSPLNCLYVHVRIYYQKWGLFKTLYCIITKTDFVFSSILERWLFRKFWSVCIKQNTMRKEIVMRLFIWFKGSGFEFYVWYYKKIKNENKIDKKSIPSEKHEQKTPSDRSTDRERERERETYK